MANKLSGFLNGAVSGATNPKGLCANWKHATRLFVDDTYRLSPRNKFLFYVHFDINPDALKAGSWDAQTHGQEIGMLVKRVNLPKISFETDIKNQYNRKKIVHKTVKYNPVQIALHDDSNAVVTSLWALYYGYYARDRHHQQMQYSFDQYSDTLDKQFGLDNNVGTSGETRPFFNSIQIFTMSRKRFVGYTLVNPRITDWTSGDADYFESDTIESSMTLEYESVLYSSGDVAENNPKGFANLHYDAEPSPLTVAGGGVANLLGEGGVLDGASQILGDVASGAAFENPAAFLSTAIKTANTIKNADNLSLKNVKGELLNRAGSVAAGVLVPLAFTATGTAMNAVGAMFPKAAEPETSAIPKSMGGASASLASAEAAASTKAGQTYGSASASLSAAQARAASALPPQAYIHQDNDAAAQASSSYSNNDYNTNGLGE